MAQAVKKAGRPQGAVSTAKSAKALMLSLKAEQSRVSSEIRKLEKRAIENGFLTKVFDKEVEIAAHTRTYTKPVWSCDEAVLVRTVSSGKRKL